jgi:hypothetical protein
MQQIPGSRAMTETIHFVPQQVLPPRTDQLTGGAALGVTGQYRKARIVHLIEVKDPFHIDNEHEEAGQKSTLQ